MARIPSNAVNILLELGIQMLKAIKELNENGKLLPPEKPKDEKGEKDATKSMDSKDNIAST
jgi:hypothetical protein